MSKRILSFVWFFIVILLFIFSVMYIKEESSQHNKQQIYNQWQYKYIVKTSQGSYVNTSANSKNRIALSEAQGYGMLISVLNNQDNFVILSARNINTVSVTDAKSVNTYELLRAKNVIFSETAIKELENLVINS